MTVGHTVIDQLCSKRTSFTNVAMASAYTQNLTREASEHVPGYDYV